MEERARYGSGPVGLVGHVRRGQEWSGQAASAIREVPLGATYLGGGKCSFLLWAPRVRTVVLHIVAPNERIAPLASREHGYHFGIVEGIEPGTRFFYHLDGGPERADPASRFQPEGVHGPSQVVDPSFGWSDQAWFGLPLREYVIYELHVGTFTAEGTFEAIIPHLKELKDLGITAIELMPLAQFPGARNWGYDGVFPFAVQNSYGVPDALKHLVDASHREGLAVVLDVVYNHLGPEGNYLNDFGSYFTDRYRTPWGSALNFDGEHSDQVRRYFLENALYWQTEFHIDALRLDAVHAIKDCSPVPFLQELARVTHRRSERLNRRFYLIAESDLNDARLLTPEALGGCGLDAQWSDDFHHCLHVLLTGERDGYYQDFGGARMLAKVLREGYAYTGEYSPFRKRRHGNSPRLTGTRQFVVFSQNHDQIGNRMRGDRLSSLTAIEGLKLAAGTVLLSPFIPLLFMGEEYGEPAPFQYVTSHTDPQLVEAVRQGRREEFASFAWQGEVPDPQADVTFQQCFLNRELCRDSDTAHGGLYAFYRELLRLRREVPALANADKHSLEIQALEPHQILSVVYPSPAEPAWLILSFAAEPVSATVELPPGQWRKILDSGSVQFAGDGGSSPGKLTSSGHVTVKLPARSLSLYLRDYQS